VNKDLNFNIEPTPAILEQDQFLESLTIKIPGINKEDLYIHNIYIPPQSSCNTPNYVPPLEHIYDGLGRNSYVLGDFNAHNELWYSESNPDQRGRLLVDTIAGKEFGIINEDLPTRIVNDTSTAPDINGFLM
jgi:hypothetical protein